MEPEDAAPEAAAEAADDYEAAAPEPSEAARLQETLESSGRPLCALPARGVAWLSSRADTEEGTREVVERLAAHVESPGFLARLTAAAAADAAGCAADGDAGAAAPCDVTRPGWWQWRRGDSAAEAEALLAQAPPPEREPEALDEYVHIEREDVVEALAFFIARFVASHPEAANLPPAKLQQALCGALAELRRGRMRRLWHYGRSVHRWGMWLYGVGSMIENPWLIKALCVALYTGGRIAIGLIF